MIINRAGLFGSVALGALVAATGVAMAGGLAVREQSTSSQGASFAGASAGGDLSSTYWNPAAAGIANGPGIHSESHYSLIVPDVEVRSNSVTTLPGSAAPAGTVLTGDTMTMDRLALVGSSYYAYRWNQDLVLGLSINAPFGLSNETSNDNWSGARHFRSAKLFTMTATPMASYRLAPGLMIGAGVQIQYAALRFKASPSSGLAPIQGNQVLDGDDVGFGFTAGVLWQPSRGTNIGLGYRSRVHHTIEGDASMANGLLATGVGLGTVPFAPIGMEASLTTPDVVNLSIRQSLAPNMRLLGSVEWTNWSLVNQIDFRATSRGGISAAPTAPGALLSRFDFQWKDGWMFSLGGEYDYTKDLTLRAGVAYELSPIDGAEARKANITDADRIWASIGATYRWSATTSFDFAYSHVFIDDGAISQLTTSPGTATTPVRRLDATANQSADIISVSIKTKW